MPQLQGLHHITAITGDAPANVDFYCRVLGLRMIKKTVNHDAPEVYHLYYADETGTPGSVLTFFEFPDARRGLAGAGMVHRISWVVGGEASLEFWSDRLAREGTRTERVDAALRFADPEGLGLELVVRDAGDPPLAAEWPEVPAEHALRGFAGVRAYAADAGASKELLTSALGFSAVAEGFTHDRPGRHATYDYDPAPATAPIQGAGSVHHVAWASTENDHESWHGALVAAGMRPTPIIDRIYFRSIYFREPSGVLFEVATLGPGFDVDEPLEHLGESLVLPPRYEAMRPWLEQNLTPVTNPRSHNLDGETEPGTEADAEPQPEGEPVG